MLTIVKEFITNAISQFRWSDFILFAILNLIYVVLNTVKTITANKANPNDKKAKRVSSWISTITYMWYTIILKKVSEIGLTSSALGTGISNYFGNYVGIGVSKKVVKRNWRHLTISISKKKYTKDQIKAIINAILDNGLKYNCHDTYQLDPITLKKTKKYLNLSIFSKSEEHDKKAEDIVTVYNLCRNDGWVEGGPVKEDI